MLFKKKEQNTGNTAILLNEHEIRSLPVVDENEESITLDGGLVLPRADAETRYYPEGGRAYVFGWTGRYLAESENISALEKNTVLRNLFDYGATTRLDTIKFFVWLGVVVVIVFLLRG